MMPTPNEDGAQSGAGNEVEGPATARGPKTAARLIVNVASPLADAVTLAPLDWIEHHPDPTTTWADVDVLDGEWIALQVRTPEDAERRAGEPVTPLEVLARLTDGDPLAAFEHYTGTEDLGPTSAPDARPGFTGVERIPATAAVLAGLHASSIAYRGAPWVRLRLGVFTLAGGPGHVLDVLLPAASAGDAVELIAGAANAAVADVRSAFDGLDDEPTP